VEVGRRGDQRKRAKPVRRDDHPPEFARQRANAPVSAVSNLASVAAQTLTVTGGVAAISRSLMFAFRAADYVTQDTANPHPDYGPGLDQELAEALPQPCGDGHRLDGVTRPARAGVFEVVSRSMPVAVTDLRGSSATPSPSPCRTSIRPKT
jgi:hypothetical protein